MIKDLIEAPDEVIEALYDGYGKSMLYTAGGAAGAAAVLRLADLLAA